KLESPLAIANVVTGQGTLAFGLRQWERARRCLAQAQAFLLRLLSQNRWPEAVGNFMAHYDRIFTLGLRACEQDRSAQPDGHPDPLWQGLAFADGAKCVAIREGLRRHGRRDTGKEPTVHWRAAPPDRGSLFGARQPAGPGNLLGVHRA